jgi:hypothetical protein
MNRSYYQILIPFQLHQLHKFKCYQCQANCWLPKSIIIPEQVLQTPDKFTNKGKNAAISWQEGT